MPNYRRANVAGGTYFFTVVTANRAPILTSDLALRELRRSVAACRRKRPFELIAAVVLPDHLHMLWTLPPGDADFSTRWAAIKATFSAAYTKAGGAEQAISAARFNHGHRGVWQQRFTEHLIRDEADWNHHVDYIHYNPVKHGHATCPHAWEPTSFHRHVRDGFYPPDWACACERPPKAIPWGWTHGRDYLE